MHLVFDQVGAVHASVDGGSTSFVARASIGGKGQERVLRGHGVAYGGRLCTFKVASADVCAWEREALVRVGGMRADSGGARVVHVLVTDATATLTGAQNLRQALVLELVEGVPVCGHLSEAEVVAFIRSICSLLHQVHAAGVVHLDIKPMNILKAANEVVLIDFGACSIDGKRRGLRTGELTAWVAPELQR